MHTSFDLLAIFIVILTQWHMSRQFLDAARRRFSPHGLRLMRRAVLVFYFLQAIGFALGFSYLASRYRLPASPSQVAGAVSQIWLFGSTASYLAYRLFRLVFDRFRGSAFNPGFDPNRRRLLNATGSALIAAPFAMVGYGALVERLDFRVREIEVPIPNLPDGLDGLRLVQLSDIHLSAFLSEKDLARVIDSANELRPHLALVTGDLITAAGDPLDACLRQISRLRADAGILGCLGNHENYAMAEDYTERAGARLGIPFLRGRAQALRFGKGVLNVAGVDYQRSSVEYLPGAERLALPGACNLLLSHNPDVFPVAARKGYDLMLAGHTHGGQVTVEILHQPVNAARFITPFVYGLYREGPAATYVTRGIGTIGIPMRIGAPPEIALLRLRKA
ncbi:MAG TPA: metallophosphoesterase [Bryobacteraceae bacterium]|nr:metallophosphoesterase [Bryobacteraceae bacterium]